MKETVAKKITKAWEDYSACTALLITIGIVIGVVVLCFGIMCLRAWFIMLLWNWIMVNLFGVPTLGFWMAFGLYLLCSLLFKSKVTVNKKSE